jgi:membrane-associated protease RseP (regulator of RpoE activity)
MKSRFLILLSGALVIFNLTSAYGQTLASKQLETEVGDHLRYTGDQVELTTRSMGISAQGEHRFVTGSFGEKGPFNIIVDTGSGVSVVDSAIAKELGLEKVGEMEVLSGGVDPIRADIVIVPEFTIEGLTILDSKFITLDLQSMSMGQLHGVLGMDVLKDALLIFDPTNDRIIISKGELSKADPGVVEFSDPEVGGISIEINAAGTSVPMVLDTGAPWGFTFPYALSNSLALLSELEEGSKATLVGQQRSTWKGQLDGDITIGDLVFTNPEIVFIDPSSPHGNIGNGILGDLLVTLDQSNRLSKMVISSPQVQKKVEKPPKARRRIGIQLRQRGAGEMEISMIQSDSLGEKAGLKKGDIIIGLNDQPINDFDMKALGKLFGGSDPLRFDIKRNGERLHVEIK